MAAEHTTPNLSGSEQQLFYYLQRFCPSVGLRWVILLLHVIMAASAGIWGINWVEHSRWLNHLSGTLAGLTRKLDSAGIHKSLNPSCCASPITWQLRTPQSTGGNELAFLKLRPTTVISVPFYWQGTSFLICHL